LPTKYAKRREISEKKIRVLLGSGAVSKMSGKRIAVDAVYIKSIACCLLPMNSKHRKEKHP
jgi:hypothetical protein